MLPGGGLENDESLEECLIREIEEETGYIVKVKNKIVTINEYYEDYLWINHYFACEIIGDGKIKLSKMEQEQKMEAKWFNLDECLNIFKEYNKYSEIDEMRCGMYKREYLSLNEYIKFINNVELWDLYDKGKKKLNKDHIRGEKIPDGAYHLVVHVWIKNKNNEYLISRRSRSRPSFPLMLECVGGSVLKNENTYDAAIREVKEEVGVDLKNIKGQFITSFVRDEYQDIVDVYEFNYDGEVSLELATTNEVEEVKWMTKDEIKELYNKGEIIKTLEYFISTL